MEPDWKGMGKEMKPEDIQQKLKEAVFGSFMGILTEAIDIALDNVRGKYEWISPGNVIRILKVNGVPVLKFSMPKVSRTDEKLILEFCVFNDPKE